MTITVLDASAALAFLLPSQATERSEALLDEAETRRFFAPPIFAWEVAHVLLRRFSTQPDRAEEGLQRLMGLPVNTQAAPDPAEPGALIAIAAAHRLSLFDAAYLDLALSLDAPLATRDAALVLAAQRATGAVIDLR